MGHAAIGLPSKAQLSTSIAWYVGTHGERVGVPREGTAFDLQVSLWSTMVSSGGCQCSRG